MAGYSVGCGSKDESLGSLGFVKSMDTNLFHKIKHTSLKKPTGFIRTHEAFDDHFGAQKMRTWLATFVYPILSWNRRFRRGES
jgi:hypothetical protein